MKVKHTITSSILTALVLVLVACSGESDGKEVPDVTADAPPTESAETVETGVNGSAEGNITPTTANGESCRDKNTAVSLSYSEALAIAEASQCAAEGQLLENHFCNENSGTWWIDLATEKVGCSPACVIDVNSGAVEINWRCTGALPPAGDAETSSNAPVPETKPAPAVFDYSGWGVYYNQKHGYEVKYPPGVTPYWEDEAEAVTFEGPLEDDEHWPMFFVGHGTTDFYRPPEDVQVREWVQRPSGQPANSYSEDTEIAGLEAYHWIFNRSPQSYGSDQYFFIKDGQMFSIVILHTGDRQDWTMYEQFLQSFSFSQQEAQTDSGSAQEKWRGVISVNPVGSQSRYKLDERDGRRWVLGVSDESLWAAIHDAAWQGVEVEISGFEKPMPGLIDVSNITTLGDPPVEPRNLSFFARPSASSVLPVDRLGTYHEWSAIDGLLESTWCEGSEGTEAGEWLQLDFESPVETTMIRMSTGYDYSDDIFAKNNRVKQATFVFSDGESIEWTFDDSRGLQSVPLARAPGPNIVTTSVKIIIEDVYPGITYDDTCIAEVEIWGRPQ